MALAMLTGVGVVVIGYWSGLAEGVEPPGSDSRVFLTAFAAVSGSVLTFLVLFLNHRVGPRPGWIAGLALAAASLGAFAWFTYEGHREDLVARMSHRGGASEQIIVTDRITPPALRTAIAYDLCPTEGLNPGLERVSHTCARALAVELYGANWPVFYPEGVDASRRVLVGWYRFAALAFMLALFLVVDAIATGTLKSRAGSNSPPIDNDVA